MSYYLHHTPGRLRAKAPALRHQPDRIQEVADSFVACPGVQRIETRAVTGSITLHFDPDETSAEELVSMLVEAGMIPKGYDFSSPRSALVGPLLEAVVEKTAEKLLEKALQLVLRQSLFLLTARLL